MCTINAMGAFIHSAISWFSSVPPNFSKMILTVLHTVLEWRHLPASIVILGSSPSYTAIWTVLKVATAPFGQKYFRWTEDCLYACYQWAESFFFEKYSGVEVSPSIVKMASSSLKNLSCYFFIIIILIYVRVLANYVCGSFKLQ